MSPSQAAVELDIVAVQAALKADGLDGWLLYDFHGSNPVAVSMNPSIGSKGRRRRWQIVVYRVL